MGDIAALALAGQLRLQNLAFQCMPVLDLRDDVAALSGACAGKAVIHCFRSFRSLLAGVVCVQFGELLQRQDGTELADQRGVVGADQGGIAHGNSAGLGRSRCDVDTAG